SYGPRRELRSFPTRRSSDVGELDSLRLEALMRRVRIEIRDNEQYVDKMISDVLVHAPSSNSPARVEYLRWASILADALSVAAYRSEERRVGKVWSQMTGKGE